MPQRNMEDKKETPELKKQAPKEAPKEVLAPQTLSGSLKCLAM